MLTELTPNHITALLRALPQINKIISEIDADLQWHDGIKQGREIMAELATTTNQIHASPPPVVGEIWRGGIYAGISVGTKDQPDGHLILLPTTPEDKLDWQTSVDWAKSLGNGAHVPTLGESSLLHANLPNEFDIDNWYWTSTVYESRAAWIKYFNEDSHCCTTWKSADNLCRAARRYPFY